MTIDRNALASAIRHQISTGEGTAYFNGGPMPDPALAELFPEVDEARTAYEAVQTEAGPLRAELRDALAKRAAHKHDPDAVYKKDADLGLVFTDARGVEMQGEIREIRRRLDAVSARAKNALHKYLVEAFSRAPEAKDAFRDRAAEADREAQELAEKLMQTLADRERFWTLAGRPVPGVSAAALPTVQNRRAAEHEQYARDLPELLGRVLKFPSL